jgi:hypothetical protein
MKFRGIQSTAPLIYQTHGNGFSDYNLRAQLGVSLDPFLNLDDFHMSQPTFKPHPHAGFSAVTYMFEDSAGAFINRDSLGDRSPIARVICIGLKPGPACSMKKSQKRLG